MCGLSGWSIPAQGVGLHQQCTFIASPQVWLIGYSRHTKKARNQLRALEIND